MTALTASPSSTPLPAGVLMQDKFLASPSAAAPSSPFVIRLPFLLLLS